jgi:DUF1126 PH-like domain
VLQLVKRSKVPLWDAAAGAPVASGACITPADIAVGADLLLYGTRVHISSCDAFTQTQLASATAAVSTAVPTVAIPSVDSAELADTAAKTTAARRVQFALSDSSSSDEIVYQFDLFNSSSSFISGDSVIGSADAALQYYVRYNALLTMCTASCWLLRYAHSIH